jgi:predicted Zn finger-like uncharacterized protein
VQATCSQCSQKIVIDDAKVPDRPFNVRCPRCQTVVRLAGKGADSAPPPAPTPPPPTPVDLRPAPDAGGGPTSEGMRAQMMAQLRREMTTGEGGGGPQALVAFPDPGAAAAITLTLTRMGYHVETVDEFDEAARLLDQGAFQVVATARVAAAQGRPESLYQRLSRLPPDARRRLFVVLVGDEFKTGEGTQAFLVLADLVLHSRDAGNADPLIRSTVAERKRLYQAYDEARRRFDESPVST